MTLDDAGSFDEKQSYVDTLRRRRTLLGYLLPSSLVDAIYSPDEIERFEEKRDDTIEAFRRHQDNIAQLADSISSGIEQAEAASNPFDVDLTSLKIRLEDAVEEAEKLDGLDEGYLTTEERNQRTDQLETVESLRSWLEVYEEVGHGVATARHHLDAARDSLAEFGIEDWDESSPNQPPSATLPRYMTRRTLRSCAREIGSAARHITDGYERVRNSELGTRYLDDLDEARLSRRRLDTFLSRYNDWYIDQEIASHQNQFTEIDEAGHDLSKEQRAAVIRDDKYNLIVAGAGSGKTVTLAHRAAYLTRREDKVLPSDILAITYTKNAAKVMESRLANRFGITNATVGTFHSVGRDVIVEETGQHPEVVTERDRTGLIKRFIRQEMDRSDSPFQREFIRFLRHYYHEADDAETEQKVEVVTNLDELQTLRGEEARSRSEKRVADFLFVSGVDYEYRVIQDWFEGVGGAGQYRPTFYLPEFDVVISHHGVDSAGEPMEWEDAEDAETYRHFVEWERRRLAEDSQIDLVETYEFEFSTGRLGDALEDRLPRAGVLFDRRSLFDLIDESYDESINRFQIISLFDSFIVNAKQLNLSPNDVDERVSDAATPKQESFGECARRLFRRYEVRLRELGAIDFPDMLHRAADYMEEDPEKYTSRYRQVLVDEFQDISAAEVRLLKCFVTPDNDTHLFCVGDDWQSIYSFSGSDVGYFIDFASYFSEPTRSDLTANYRCPETVVAAGDTLIANNERQLEKETNPLSGTDTTIHVHDLGTTPRENIHRWKQIELAATLVERSIDDGTPPGEIMVLSRSKTFYDDLEEACAERGIKASQKPEKEDVPEEYVRLYSVHKSKGDEAEHVIIIHAVEDIVGFPSQVEDSNLLDPVRIELEEDSEAEERRLFYVALTRTTDKLDIVASVGNRSRFVDEIETHLTVAPTVNALGDNERRTDVETALVSRLFETRGSVDQAGVLSDWSGTRKFTIFDETETEPLEKDTRYRIENARIDEYQGDYSFILDSKTQVTTVTGGD